MLDVTVIECQAEKWAECIGKSLYMQHQGKKPFVEMIITEPKEEKYYIRLKTILDDYGIESIKKAVTP